VGENFIFQSPRRRVPDFWKIPKHLRLVAQSWYLHFWRSDECPKRITLNLKVRGLWERISFFKVQEEGYLIFEKFQKIKQWSHRAGFSIFGGPMSVPKESHWIWRSEGTGREFHFSKYKEKLTWFLKNSKTSMSSRKELVFAFLEVRWVSQRKHIELEGPKALGENFIFRGQRRRVPDFWKIPKNRGLITLSWFLHFWRSDECP